MAEALNRVDGVHAVPMQEVYPNHQFVTDETWIRDMGKRGWICVTQNPYIRSSAIEMAAIREAGARVFSLKKGDYSQHTQGFIFGRNFVRLRRRATKPGACFWRIGEGDPLRDIP